MIFHIKQFRTETSLETSPIPISLRCPSCRQQGTFESLNVMDVYSFGQPERIQLGQRRCPNPECRAHVFIARDKERLLVSYPAERIDFDTTNIPASVVNPLEEAITCHANQCFMAAAIMVRKTLEELCRDRNAQGKNLKARIADLGTKIVLPKELLEGVDDLRLLGNDAAHIESQEFNQIGQEEVEIGIEFTKEVLKATYQYSALLSRLRSLKRQPT